MTDKPEWAMEKAREVVLTLCPDMDQRLQRKIDEIPLAKAITRALVAEYERGFTDGRDDVAVERRERDAYARGVKEEREAATMAERERISVFAMKHEIDPTDNAQSREWHRGYYAARKRFAAIRAGE